VFGSKIGSKTKAPRLSPTRRIPIARRPLPGFNNRMPDPRQQKITFGEMRASGVRGVLIYCSDYKCSHSTAISADRWQDDVRPSFDQTAKTIRPASVR
jgi:hypothetical protein